MSDSPHNPNPLDFASFREHYRVPGDEIAPDPQDFDPDVAPETDRDRAAELSMAQARKLNRLFERWKAEQN
jgi:hypothetical protein